MLPDWNRYGATPRRAVPLAKRQPKHPQSVNPLQSARRNEDSGENRPQHS